jgi:regulation of enolase protein 1 (concanavalin A-like superfamily)
MPGRLVFLLPLLTTGFVASAAPVPKEHPERVLRRLFGTPIDPDQDCRFTVSGATLRVSVPARPHDLAPDRRLTNAPRVVRRVEGDFAARVRIRFPTPADPALAKAAAAHPVRAGLVVWQDEENFLIFGREFGRGGLAARFDHAQHAGYHAAWVRGRSAGGGGWIVGGPFSEESAVYRVLRERDRLRFAASVDGKHWHEWADVRTELPNAVMVGLYVGHGGQTPFAAEFEDFSVNPAKPGK